MHFSSLPNRTVNKDHQHLKGSSHISQGESCPLEPYELLKGAKHLSGLSTARSVCVYEMCMLWALNMSSIDT